MSKPIWQIICLLLLISNLAYSQNNKFYPMEAEWPTPDLTRLANGAPGPAYWQQQADYVIDVQLDEAKQTLSGSEIITYHNNSPFPLEYLWLQIDQNIRRTDSEAHTGSPQNFYPTKMDIQGFVSRQSEFEGGMTIKFIRDSKNKSLPYTISGTNLRIDLPVPLASGKKLQLKLGWTYPINDATLEGRSGYENLEGDYLFEVAQFYPRMCVFDNVKGWENTPFLGPAEFALEFGDFQVNITVPANHLVAATGELQNGSQVLSSEIQSKLKSLSGNPGKVVSIVGKGEAESHVGETVKRTKTWVFKAKNVRDFAFATCKKFLWDAAEIKIGGNSVRVQSFYPPEGLGLWDKYATHSAIHTLNVYSKYTVDYPYPTANVIHGPVWGMEYPMMAFCGGRTEPDQTYTERGKYAMISVVIHEVGHNFFPMIVNSDERRWAWMDEGLNSFLQFLTEQEFELGYPPRRGVPEKLESYLNGKRKTPIMTNVGSIKDNGGTSYHKTAVGLNMLRETIIGREGFDHAFKTYAQRWKFKHPEPADFFRSMEDVSGVDLDWFWRNWFYGNETVDLAVKEIIQFKPDGNDPKVLEAKKATDETAFNSNLSLKTNRKMQKEYYTESHPELKDFYSRKDDAAMNAYLEKRYQEFLETLAPDEVELIQAGKNIYVVSFENLGGCPMPIVFQANYADGSSEEFRIPASIWRLNNTVVRREIKTEKELVSILLDPHREIPDVDRGNNSFPKAIEKRSIQLYQKPSYRNPMQR